MISSVWYTLMAEETRTKADGFTTLECVDGLRAIADDYDRMAKAAQAVEMTRRRIEHMTNVNDKRPERSGVGSRG